MVQTSLHCPSHTDLQQCALKLPIMMNFGVPCYFYMGKTIPFISFCDLLRACVTISHSEKSQKEQLIPGVLFVKDNLAKHCPSSGKLILNLFIALDYYYQMIIYFY